MKNVLTISLFASALLMAGTPVHDQLDARIKGKSFGGTTDDYVAASDGLGAMVLQQHTGLTEINNELITQKVFDRVLKSETDKTKTADIRTSLSTGVIGTANDKAILLNVGTELAPPSLYAFTSHTFTTCGQSGQTGPSLGQCTAAYSTDWDNDVTKFKMTTTGIQEWVVPADGSYRIEAYGAEGGRPATIGGGVIESRRGVGAIIRGDFNLSKGDVLNIVVGQSGSINTSGNYANGGGHGGGGSFVWKNGTVQPLIAAGGGGGLSICNTSGNYDYCAGKPGSTNTSGLPSFSNVSNFGTNGSNATYANGAKGWTTMLSTLNFNGDSTNYGGTGGFGGGGRGFDSSTHAGGGGGGYSGGGGGQHAYNSGSGNTDGRNGGGGGGSYNSGTNQSASTGNRGHGSVTITKI